MLPAVSFFAAEVGRCSKIEGRLSPIATGRIPDHRLSIVVLATVGYCQVNTATVTSRVSGICQAAQCPADVPKARLHLFTNYYFISKRTEAVVAS